MPTPRRKRGRETRTDQQDVVLLPLSGFEVTTMPLSGPHSITTPGAVRSWGSAHERHGRLSREALLAPAIELAAGGFPAWDGYVSAV